MKKQTLNFLISIVMIVFIISVANIALQQEKQQVLP